MPLWLRVANSLFFTSFFSLYIYYIWCLRKNQLFNITQFPPSSLIFFIDWKNELFIIVGGDEIYKKP